MIQNIILIAILLAVIGGAAMYICKEKKNGAACIGCPYSKNCSSKKAQGGCNCGCDDKK